MPSVEDVEEDISIEEQIRLAQASGLLAQPSVLRRSNAGHSRDPLISKIPSTLEGANFVEVDYRDADAAYTPEGATTRSSRMREVQMQAQTEKMDLGDEIFLAGLYVIPLSSLYLLLDILAHKQYAKHPSFEDYVSRLIQAVPTLALLVFMANRYPNHWLTNPLLMTTSILCGSRLIWLVNKASYILVMQQAPPVGTLWIFTIIQLSLGRAVISLVAVLGWCWRNGMKFQP